MARVAFYLATERLALRAPSGLARKPVDKRAAAPSESGNPSGAQPERNLKSMLRRSPNLLLVPLFLLLLAILFPQTIKAQCEFTSDYDTFDFSRKTLKREEIENLTMEDFKYMRGILFGRHGRIFKDAEIRNYLKCRPWFKPNPNFSNSLLNETERANLDLIREMEAKKHEWIEPGDMRFYRDRVITEKMLGWHTAAEWRVLRAEVEAIYGKRFTDEPWLQKYFEERYWYEPKANYDPKQLSEIERQNIEIIAAAQKKQRNVGISPGDMELFQETSIKEEMLYGLSLQELRLLRNEIYARRGRKFGAAWLQRYFDTQDW
ncbi:MAG: YARHG domain-containing protein, partial [Acidobacteria bacterium]|nr:YARHG domain-containing protein [Acidobacteriota bacterium]